MGGGIISSTTTPSVPPWPHSGGICSASNETAYSPVQCGYKATAGYPRPTSHYTLNTSTIYRAPCSSGSIFKQKEATQPTATVVAEIYNHFSPFDSEINRLKIRVAADGRMVAISALTALYLCSSEINLPNALGDAVQCRGAWSRSSQV